MTEPVDDHVPDDSSPDEPMAHAPRQPNHDVFVSYSTRDKPVADAVVSRLEQANIRCWVAPRDVMPGMVWAEAIIAAIATSRLMVVVLSGAANESPQVLREVERAVASGAVVIPFRIESVEPTGAMAYYLAGEHWLDALNPPLESHIAQLVRVAQTLLDRPPVATSEAAVASAPLAQGDSSGRRSMRTLGLVIAGLVTVVGVLAAIFIVSSGPADPASTSSPVAAGSPTATATPTTAESPAATPTPSVASTPSGEASGVETSVFDLQTGDCFTLSGDQLSTVLVVDCEETHIHEVFALVDHEAGPGEPYPGDAMSEYADGVCRGPFVDYVGRDYESSTYWIATLTPSEETWADGDREIVCTLKLGAEGEPTTGSARDSGQ